MGHRVTLAMRASEESQGSLERKEKPETPGGQETSDPSATKE